MNELNRKRILEIKRQSLHLLLGVVLLILYFSISSWVLLILIVLGIFFGLYLIMNHRKLIYNKYFNFFIENFERQNADFLGKGVLMYLLGVLTALILQLIFKNKLIFPLALVPLVYGDFFSTLVGTFYGKKYFLPNKTLEGTFAGFITTFIFSLLIIAGFREISFATMLKTLLFSVSYFVELMPLEDNFFLPLFGGLFAVFLF
jgi:dolichol kinase